MKGRPQGGFMLVEALVWLMLTALLLQAVFPMLAVSFLSWETSVAHMQTHQTARMAMETMTRELRYANSIVSPSGEQPANELNFTKIDSSGISQNLTFKQGSSPGKNMNTLYRINTRGEPSPITQNVVSDLYFQFIPPRLVFVSLTLTDQKTQVSDTVQTSITCVNVPD